jgi:poly(hydroxyalkanoate) depolymerase family esterase
MNDEHMAAMAEATALTRAGRLAEATALIRRTLPGGPAAPVDVVPGEVVEPRGVPRGGASGEGPPAGGGTRCPDGGVRGLLRKHLGKHLGKAAGVATHLPDTSTLPDLSGLSGLPGLSGGLPGTAAPAGPVLPGESLTRTHRGPAGERPYFLYVPTTGQGPRPLVVMLHGGTQTAADFAAATRMSVLAEEHGFLVAYPEQVTSANAMRYWNWFQPTDQRREGGEPAILAGIVADVAAAHAVDRDRVYVAGFSAGAAMAAVLGATHPDVFAAVGVHSGLPHGCAHDVASAFAAMRQGPRVRPLDRPVPVIAFHGDADTTVAAANATRVVEQFAGVPATGGTTTERGSGRTAGRTVVRRDGAVVAEQWTVHGSGHAWSGGAAGGSYTDPAGPAASAEMVRFFAEHPRRA